MVLFPGMVLLLHVFELRYREMINHCIEEEKPFGVVLIDEGQEVGSTPRLAGVAAPGRDGGASRASIGWTAGG